LEKLEIVRVTKSELTAPQVGFMLFDGYPELITFELPDLDNKKSKSCIPEGEYSCERVLGVTTLGGMYIPETFRVLDVPGRSGILFHIGNSVKDSSGCILLGLKLGGQGPLPGISESKIGFNKFLALTKHTDRFLLTISHA
jgi:hypothetical protein